MKKKAKKWFSCITAAALVMSTVNLPIDVLASNYEDGVEISVEDEQMDFSDMENSEDLEIEDVPEDVLVEEETDTEEGASDLEIETELFTDTEEITESTDEILSETGSEINTFSSRAGGMTTGENGYSLIKQFESCRLTAYKADDHHPRDAGIQRPLANILSLADQIRAGQMTVRIYPA